MEALSRSRPRSNTTKTPFEGILYRLCNAVGLGAYVQEGQQIGRLLAADGESGECNPELIDGGDGL